MCNWPEVQLRLRTEILAIPELPSALSWTDIKFRPKQGHPWVEEDFNPGGGHLIGNPDGGTRYEEGIAIFKWYAVAGRGISALTGVQFILNKFSPGAQFITSVGDRVIIKGDQLPVPTRAVNTGTGWSVSSANVPFYVLSISRINQ